MSSLWTPGGEHPVDRDTAAPAASTPADQAVSDAKARGDGLDQMLAGLPEEQRAEYEAMLGDLTDEQRAEFTQRLAEMAESQQRLVETPAEVLVTNHAAGLYELAALHLQQQPPNLLEAKLAIDAMAALMEGVAGRLGEHEAELKAALTQIQLGFVQVQSAYAEAPDA